MLRERKALERLGAEIQKPYPESAFAELTKAEWATVHDVLRGAGISLDRVSASNMRHVGKMVAEARERFREALASEPASVGPEKCSKVSCPYPRNCKFIEYCYITGEKLPWLTTADTEGDDD